jgi:hypothetical protein
VNRCALETLNGTDVKGKIVFCSSPIAGEDPTRPSPVKVYGTALGYIYSAGGSGLVFAQYTTDLLADDCKGLMACVLVDRDTGNQIMNYIGTTRCTAF